MSETPPRPSLLSPLGEMTEQDWLKAMDRADRIEISRQDWYLDQLSRHKDYPFLKDHDCFKSEHAETFIGLDGGWEIHLLECTVCSRRFLRCSLEDDGMVQSGRWYLGRFPPDTLPRDIVPARARSLLRRLDRVFYGGRYWGHDGEWCDEPARLPDLAG